MELNLFGDRQDLLEAIQDKDTSQAVLIFRDGNGERQLIAMNDSEPEETMLLALNVLFGYYKEP